MLLNTVIVNAIGIATRLIIIIIITIFNFELLFSILNYY